MHLTFGTSIHETVQNYLTILYDKSGLEADNMNLEEYFQERFSENYRKDYEKNKNNHFSSAEEMGEFYEDGLAILEFIQKNRSKYFSKRDWHLIGCEIPIFIRPYSAYIGVIFKGFIDLVLYHENTETFFIYDIKTSTNSWGDYQKKDEIKQAQVLLYKQFFAQQFGVKPEKIKVEFFILKRKLWEGSEFQQKRIQQFVPSQGSWKLKQSMGHLEKFIKDCFNEDGSYKDREFKMKPSSKCKYCPFNDKKELCDKGIIS